MEEKQYHLCLDTLSNELRFRILELIKKKPMSVTALAKELNAERSRVSHSLSMLKLCSIASVERKGKEMMYAVNPNSWPMKVHEKQAMAQMLDHHISSHCGSCHKLGA